MVTQQAEQDAVREFKRMKPYLRVPQILLGHPGWTHAQARIALFLIGRCAERDKPLGISKDVICHWSNTSLPTVEEALEYFASDDPSQLGWLTIHRGRRGLRNQYSIDMVKMHNMTAAVAAHLGEEVEYIEPTKASSRRRKAVAK